MSSVPALRTTDLIGRDAELEQLSCPARHPCVRGAGGASVRAMLVAGDAGVGKTRLMMALRDTALEAGWQVVAGHCLDLADSSLPYLPFSEILGRVMADQPDVAGRVLDRHPTLARLQPGRRIRSSETASGDQALDRGNVYDAFGDLLSAVAEQAPVLVVVEDAHWADESTRDMLSFLFSRPVPGVSLVVSYRSDDLHRRHPLRRQVAEWMRLHGVDRLPLDPLADDDVRRLVRALRPGTLSEAEYVSIVDRAEGNPFFVEELVGAAGSGQVPGELADVLLVHLDRLDEVTRRVVRIVSVAGRQVSHGLLAAVSDLGSAELEGALRTAVEANVLAASRGGTYAFRHALLGEAVYDDLLPGERVRLHADFVVRAGGGPRGRHGRRAGPARPSRRRPPRGGPRVGRGRRGGPRRRRPVGGGHPLPRRARAHRHLPHACVRPRPARARTPLRGGARRRRPGAQGGQGAAGPAGRDAARRLRRRPRPAADGDGRGPAAHRHDRVARASSRPRRWTCCAAARPGCSRGRSSCTPRASATGTPTRRARPRSRRSRSPSATTSPASPSSCTPRWRASTRRAGRTPGSAGGPPPTAPARPASSSPSCAPSTSSAACTRTAATSTRPATSTARCSSAARSAGSPGRPTRRRRGCCSPSR